MDRLTCLGAAVQCIITIMLMILNAAPSHRRQLATFDISQCNLYIFISPHFANYGLVCAMCPIKDGNDLS